MFAEEPAFAEEPVFVEEPVFAEEPVCAEEPVLTEEPAFAGMKHWVMSPQQMRSREPKMKVVRTDRKPLSLPQSWSQSTPLRCVVSTRNLFKFRIPLENH